MTQLSKAILKAERYWTGPGGIDMCARVNTCVVLLGGLAKLPQSTDQITADHGHTLLARLKGRGYAPATIGVHYSAFRRMLELSGKLTADWPKPPTLPRKPRQAIPELDLGRIDAELRSTGCGWTADLAHVLRHTGMRVDVEALAKSWRLEAHPGLGYASLYITGKGGHERCVPVVDPKAVRLLALAMPRSDRDLGSMCWADMAYSTHAKRWKAAVVKLGVRTRLPTLHAVRHSYATRIGDLATAQDLLGHADPATTARYLDVGMDRKLEALRA